VKLTGSSIPLSERINEHPLGAALRLISEGIDVIAAAEIFSVHGRSGTGVSNPRTMAVMQEVRVRVPSLTKRVAPISLKPTRVQKGTLWCTFLTSFSELAKV
jgi:hypothetical protein